MPDQLALLDSRWLAWALLALPGFVMTVRYATGATVYGEYLHATGELGAEPPDPRLGGDAAQTLVSERGLGRVARTAQAVYWRGNLRLLATARGRVRRAPGAGTALEDAAELAFVTGWLALARDAGARRHEQRCLGPAAASGLEEAPSRRVSQRRLSRSHIGCCRRSIPRAQRCTSACSRPYWPFASATSPGGRRRRTSPTIGRTRTPWSGSRGR